MALLLHIALIRAVLVHYKQCYKSVSDHWMSPGSYTVRRLQYSSLRDVSKLYCCCVVAAVSIAPQTSKISLYMFHANLWHFFNTFILSLLQWDTLWKACSVLHYFNLEVSGAFAFILLPVYQLCQAVVVETFFFFFCTFVTCRTSGWKCAHCGHRGRVLCPPSFWGKFGRFGNLGGVIFRLIIFKRHYF